MTEPAKLTLGMLKELVAQHAPVLFMHPRDAFMPCSVEWFMDHSELWLLGEELVSKKFNISAVRLECVEDVIRPTLEGYTLHKLCPLICHTSNVKVASFKLFCHSSCSLALGLCEIVRASPMLL